MPLLFYFASVDDYLSREEKLGQLIELGSVLSASLSEIKPDAHGDWLNQRRDDFGHFITVDGKKAGGLVVFENYSLGINTNRDAWSYNSNKGTIESSFTECISFYNAQVESLRNNPTSFVRDNNELKIKWSSSLIPRLERKELSPPFSADNIVTSLYRPFFKQWLYNEKTWVHRVAQMPQLFPFSGTENLVIGTITAESKTFTCLMSNCICDLNLLKFGTQCFPRYLYRKVESDSGTGGLLDSVEQPVQSGVINGYERVDAIRPEAVQHFKDAYPEEAAAIDVDAVFYYIYGILHSPDYRETYASNLQKELPRIPRVASYANFKAFSDAGRALAQLHVGYEQVKPYDGCKLSYAKGVSSDNMDYRVTQLKYGKIKGKTGAAAKDKTVIVYNDDLTISNIPLEAQEYVVAAQSALDWVVERCRVKVDKDSHIVNDYNDYAKEVGDERYILNLILRVITVSLETMKIVKALPPLTIHKLDQ